MRKLKGEKGDLPPIKYKVLKPSSSGRPKVVENILKPGNLRKECRWNFYSEGSRESELITYIINFEDQKPDRIPGITQGVTGNSVQSTCRPEGGVYIGP